MSIQLTLLILALLGAFCAYGYCESRFGWNETDLPECVPPTNRALRNR